MPRFMQCTCKVTHSRHSNAHRERARSCAKRSPATIQLRDLWAARRTGKMVNDGRRRRVRYFAYKTYKLLFTGKCTKSILFSNARVF